MTILTVQFEYPDTEVWASYETLLNVFKKSVEINQPDCKFVDIRIPAEENPNPDKPINFWYNGVKLRKWVEYLETHDEDIIFADCDMIMMNDASSAFDHDFDIAYTRRSKVNTIVIDGKTVERMPMNGGIMFARPTERARQFYRDLLEINDKMFNDVKFHEKYRARYAGMNQAAFGYVFENMCEDIKIHTFYTREWNAVDCDWPYINDKTKFLHIKSKLRKLCLHKHMPYGNFKKAMQEWCNIAEQTGVNTWKS